MRSAGVAPPESHFSPLLLCSPHGPRYFLRPREAPGAPRAGSPHGALHEGGGKEEPRASEAALNRGSLSPEEEGLERRGGVKTRGGMILSSG